MQIVGRSSSHFTRMPLMFAHELGVPFGEHPRQVTDFYYPNVEPSGPVLVFIHGGGFTGGTPRSVGHYGRHFRDAGVIYAAVSYRVLPETQVEGSAEVVPLPEAMGICRPMFRIARNTSPIDVPALPTMSTWASLIFTREICAFALRSVVL